MTKGEQMLVDLGYVKHIEGGKRMEYKCAKAIIKTRRKTPHGNIDKRFTVITEAYRNVYPDENEYDGYICDSFKILEYSDGKVLIITEGIMKYSGAKMERAIIVENCQKIEIYSLEE